MPVRVNEKNTWMVKPSYPHRNKCVAGREIDNLAGQGFTSETPGHYIYNGNFL